MAEYIVSARKYRPDTFDSVVGQRALTTTLKNSIANGKLAHAYLFCGPRGVGKTTCARIFAKTINCLNPHPDGEACGECESCKAFNEQRSMNIHELDAASNNSVEDIREICKQVLIPPQVGRYKIFIIDEVHMLSSAAFNAFLKTLEEPPSYAVFILATTEKHKILPTILSRCQVYDFARMTIQGTIDHLQYVAEKEGYTAEPEALNLIAKKADGGMRDALSIFDQMVSFTGGNLTYELVCKNLNELSTDYYFRLVDCFLDNKVEDSLLLLNEVLQKGFDGGNFIDGLASHLRDLLVSRDAQTLPLLETSEQMRGRYQEQAQRCQPRFLFRAIKLCNDCNQNYRNSRNKRLQVEICLIQACQLTTDDTPVAGLGPAQTIKPIFQQTAKAAEQPQPAAQKAVQATTTATVAPAPAPARPVTRELPKKNTTKVADQTVIDPKKLSRFSRLSSKSEETTKEMVEEETVIVNDRPIDVSMLQTAWHQFINTLPHDETALALRMRNMNPTLKDANTIGIKVNNNQVADMLKVKEGEIVAFLRQHLQHSDIRMEYTIAEMEEIQRSFSKPELYKHFVEQQPALALLARELKLELD